MSDEIPFCAAADPEPRAPRWPLPAGACDCHAHVFGPASRYAYSPGRGYTPPDALPADYARLHRVLGVTRGVLTQPSVYGTDNTATLDGVAEDPENRRAVVAVGAGVGDAELERMHAAGARGIRVNLADKGGMPFDSFADVVRIAERIRPFGWHLELLIHVHEFPELKATLGGLPVDIVVGHFGYMPAAAGIDNPGFRAFLDLVRDGHCWVKMTAPYRITARDGLPYDDVAPLARALAEARPDRMLWGSDWPHPHIRTGVPMPNDGDLVDQFCDWLPDEALRRRILVDNPAALYGFD